MLYCFTSLHSNGKKKQRTSLKNDKCSSIKSAYGLALECIQFLQLIDFLELSLYRSFAKLVGIANCLFHHKE